MSMFPQPLVQNKIISNPKNSSFELDWFLAAPIVNANFFHISKMIDEQTKYRALLRPWKDVTTENKITTSNYTSLQIHEYGYSSTRFTRTPLNIYVGSLMGRIHYTSTHPNSDFFVITPNYVRYGFEDGASTFTEIYDLNYPAMIRRPLANLEKIYTYTLGREFRLNTNNHTWSWVCTNPSTIRMSPSGATNTDYPYIRRATDKVFGRIKYNDECIANIPIIITKQWNALNAEFDITFSFKDLNFPNGATVELY